MKFWKPGRGSHTELMFDDLMCFSSTNRTGEKGCRMRPGAEVLKHPENWICHRIDILSYAQELKIRIACEERIWHYGRPWYKLWGEKTLKKRRGYDWLGVVGFRFFGMENPKLDYCTEYCNDCLGAGFPILPRRQVGPDEMLCHMEMQEYAVDDIVLN